MRLSGAVFSEKIRVANIYQLCQSIRRRLKGEVGICNEERIYDEEEVGDLD